MPVFEGVLTGAGAPADPYPVYKILRGLGPVVHLTRHGLYALPRYREVLEVLTCTARPPVLLAGAVHTRLREHLRGRAQEAVARHARGGRLDAAALSREVVAGLMAHLLGLPPLEAGRLPGPGSLAPARDALDALAPLLDRQPPHPGSARHAWRREHTGQRPHAADTPGPWARHVVPALDIAAQGVLGLLERCARQRSHWSSLRAAPARAEPMWHEQLRLRAPCPGAVHEITRGIRLAGLTLPAGSRVLLLYGSAGRDTAQWGPRADLYQPGRPAASAHLSLGEAPRQSTGRQLAGLYATTLLNALARHAPVLRPDGDPATGGGPALAGYTRLPLHAPRPPARARPARTPPAPAS